LNALTSTAVPREIPVPDILVLLNCDGLRGKNQGRGGIWGTTEITERRSVTPESARLSVGLLITNQVSSSKDLSELQYRAHVRTVLGGGQVAGGCRNFHNDKEDK
jgi:hypothetical protein